MGECSSNFFILNGNLVPADNFENDLVFKGESVYEVLRLMDGVPVFFNDHMERLVLSAKSLNKDVAAEIPLISEGLIRLISVEKNFNSNVKVVLNYRNDETNCIIYFISTSYPTALQYENGVKGILFFAERKDPGTKIINNELRSAISAKLLTENAYEAILVNENSEITEGSRSNIFFLKNEILFTAPDSVVLNGITRKNIIKICTERNIILKYRCVRVEELADFDSVFITGTSPIALPFSSIGEFGFKTRFSLIQKLRELYLEKAVESIRLFKAGK